MHGKSINIHAIMLSRSWSWRDSTTANMRAWWFVDIHLFAVHTSHTCLWQPPWSILVASSFAHVQPDAMSTAALYTYNIYILPRCVHTVERCIERCVRRTRCQVRTWVLFRVVLIQNKDKYNDANKYYIYIYLYAYKNIHIYICQCTIAFYNRGEHSILMIIINHSLKDELSL